jgi:hypothetical protein
MNFMIHNVNMALKVVIISELIYAGSNYIFSLCLTMLEYN